MCGADFASADLDRADGVGWWMARAGGDQDGRRWTEAELEAHAFRLFVLDWDGTAVTDLHADATAIAAALDRLLAFAPVVVVTCTNFDDVARQLDVQRRVSHRRALYLATNRGSEVWGFDETGAPQLLHRRQATPEEERKLDAAADGLADVLRARAGIEVSIVRDRLNRRKVDLIPESEWHDPSKARVAELLAAVEARLRQAGLGLQDVLTLAERIAIDRGLAESRVTSDVKHVEIGLTDKGHSIDWVLAHLAAELPSSDILVAGDEFGPIVGIPGSDSLMVRPALSGAAIISVGREPGGVPAPVLHLAGGPARFAALLETQAALHERACACMGGMALPARPTADPRWVLVEEGFELAREHEIESRFAVSNGYLGSRAALAEGSPLSSPATFVAGLYGRDPGSPAPVQLAPMPDWMRLAGDVEGEPLRLDHGTTLLHRRTLDLRHGIVWREWHYQDRAGRRTRILGMRLVSLADRHLLFQAVLLLPENWAGRLSFQTRIDRPVAPGPALLPRPLPVEPPPGVVALALRPAGGRYDVALAAASGVKRDAQWLGAPAEQKTSATLARVDRWHLDLEMGRPVRLDRLVAMSTSRDAPDPAADAIERVVAGRGRSEALLAEHVAAWESRWRRAHIELDGDPASERALRFAAYHMIGAASPSDDRVSIGARGLTGPAYLGHVFWDTEIFMLPFFQLTEPAVARALLGYRFHSLPAARDKARSIGCEGALYAWESADDGAETTPRRMMAPDGVMVDILCGEQEHHISADVAYGVWSYLRATGDEEFLIERGAEILFETARFWMSRSGLEADGRAHIRGVLGPDEYHPGVDDNAYTNALARFNLLRADAAAGRLASVAPERLRALGVEEPERARWRERASELVVGFDPRTRLFEQFAGYFALEDIDVVGERRLAPADLVLGRERVNRSRLVKQPDVVLLVRLLWDELAPDVRARNFDYYERRTWHGSSLSPPMHALVAARLGRTEMALDYFAQTAAIDLADGFGNAAGGVHIGALGGLWQAAIAGFAGVDVSGAGLTLSPRLPPSWRALRFTLTARGQPIQIACLDEGRAVEVVHEGDRPLPVALGDRPAELLVPGRHVAVQKGAEGYGPWVRDLHARTAEGVPERAGHLQGGG